MRNIPFGRPIISEKEKQAVSKVLDGNILVHGPLAKEFESKFSAFTGSAYSISTSSCTASLHLAYFDQGVASGHEVIVPAMTHVATAHAVELCGARPVFVDAEPDTGNMDLRLLEDAITPRTRAVSVVHYLGMPVNMEEVMRIARKHHLFVVEDCALGVGSRYKGQHVGTFGDYGCFSFYPVKHMTTAEGGMTTVQDKTHYDRISRKKAFGVDRTMAERSIPGFYDVTMLGFNYRMNEIAACLGIHQLDSVAGFLSARERNYQRLERGFREIPEARLFRSTHGDYLSSYYCFSIVLQGNSAKRRAEIVEFLRSRGVGTSIYYPQPVPAFTYYKEKYGENLSRYPVAAEIASRSIALPVGPHLSEEDMDYIVETFRNALADVSAR